MDRLEYKEARDSEYTKLGNSIKNKLKVLMIGSTLTVGLLTYDVIDLYSYIHNLRKDPVMNEICLAVKENDLSKATTLRSQTDKIKEYTPSMLKKIKQSRYTEKAAFGILGASFLYFLIGSGVSSLKTFKKTQALEKELLKIDSN
jgi:hypothetical protein